MTAVYLSEQQIQIVSGDLEQKRVKTVRKRLSNGKADEVSRILRSVWNKHSLPKSDVILVTDDAGLSGMTVEMPILNAEQTVDFLVPEFRDRARNGDEIFSWLVLHEDKVRKLRRVFATMASRETVNAYRELFESADIALCDICTPLTAVHALLSRTSGFDDGTSVLLHWDGAVLMSTLFEDGRYAYSDTKTLSHLPGTPGFSVELSREVSRLAQSVEAQNAEARIARVWVSGVNADDFSFCADGIYQVDPQIDVIDLTERLAGQYKGFWKDGMALIPFGAMLMGESYSGLLSQMNVNRAKRRERREMLRNMRPVIGLTAVLCIAAALFGVQNVMLRHQLNELKSENSAPAVVSAIAEYDMLSEEQGRVMRQIEELSDDRAAAESYPLPSGDVMDTIEGYSDSSATVTVRSYDAATGTASVDIRVKNADSANQFIDKLSRRDLFEHVEYTGYRYDDASQLWVVDATCTLAQTAGR